MTGQKLGHYRIIEQIGAGGMGVVYRAHDERLERHVAIKVLPPGTLSDEGSRKQFRKEALVLSRLNHPNIATVHDFDTQDGVDFLVLEYIPGEGLDEKLARGPLPSSEIRHLGSQLAQGLAAAHKEGVVHLDLKPSNIRVTSEGLLKILDFGLARLRRPEDHDASTLLLSEIPAVAGTVPYMAPEQLRAESVDQRADIYGTGAVLYEMATGQLPFGRLRGPQLITAILESDPPAPRSLNSRVPPGLESIILKALDKDPNRRYQSAKELGVDLERESAPVPPFPPSPRPRRRVVVGALLALGVLLLATIPGLRRTVVSYAGLSGLPEHKYLAVLPFQAIGGAEDKQAFCDGLSETVTASLNRLAAGPTLEVTPASEIRKRGVTGPKEARKELGVSLVLEGTLDFSAGMVRVNYALIDASTLKQLASDTVTASASDLFALQDRVVAGAIRMLEVELDPSRQRGPPKRGTHVASAHDFYIQGRGYLQYYDKPDSVDSAIKVFERALAVDPDYASAYAGLGEAYWQKYEKTRETAWVDKARTACEKAVKLDPELAAGHVCLGTLYNGTGQYEEGLLEFKQALRAEPSNDDAYRGLANAQEHLGHVEEAEQNYRFAIQLRPHYWSGYSWLGVFLYHRGRYKEAAEQFEQAIALRPDNSQAYRSLGGLYIYMGRYHEAIASLEKAIQLQPNYEAYTNLGAAFIHLRRFEEAAMNLEQALKLGATDYRVCGSLARSYYWLPGKRDQALRMYERAIQLAQERLRINARDADAEILLANYYAMLGRRKQAFDSLRRAFESQPERHEFFIIAAIVHAQFGDRAAAFDHLEKAIAQGCSPAELYSYIELDSLRDDPRFQQLTRTPPGTSG